MTRAARKTEPKPHTLQVSVDRAEFAEALARIIPAIEKRSSIPVLAGVLVDIETGAIRLTGTNLDQQLRVTIPAVADGPAHFVICDAHMLNALVKQLDGKTIEMAIGEGERPDFSIAAAKTDGQFVTLPAVDFPTFTMPTADAVTLAVNGDALSRAIDRVEHAISDEETRYYLNGIHLHRRRGRPWMAATNGHVLALAMIDPELGDAANDDGAAYSAIIPRGAVPMLRAIAKRGAVELRLYGSTHLEIEQDGFSFASKMIDGTFPDIDRVIPNNAQHAVLPVETIEAAVKRCRVAVKDKVKAIKIILEGSAATLESRGGDGARIFEIVELPAAVTQRLEHGLNTQLLLNFLSTFNGAIKYRYADAASPIVLHSDDVASIDEAAHFGVLMPMRV